MMRARAAARLAAAAAFALGGGATAAMAAGEGEQGAGKAAASGKPSPADCHDTVCHSKQDMFRRAFAVSARSRAARSGARPRRWAAIEGAAAHRTPTESRAHAAASRRGRIENPTRLSWLPCGPRRARPPVVDPRASSARLERGGGRVRAAHVRSHGPLRRCRRPTRSCTPWLRTTRSTPPRSSRPLRARSSTPSASCTPAGTARSTSASTWSRSPSRALLRPAGRARVRARARARTQRISGGCCPQYHIDDLGSLRGPPGPAFRPPGRHPPTSPAALPAVVLCPQRFEPRRVLGVALQAPQLDQ